MTTAPTGVAISAFTSISLVRCRYVRNGLRLFPCPLSGLRSCLSSGLRLFPCLLSGLSLFLFPCLLPGSHTCQLFSLSLFLFPCLLSGSRTCPLFSLILLLSLWIGLRRWRHCPGCHIYPQISYTIDAGYGE